jgi:hypothetical protein
MVQELGIKTVEEGEGVEMKKMPESLKKKLRRLQKLHEEAKQLDYEVNNIFKSYGVDVDVLCASNDAMVRTEALAFITNAEGYVEDNIDDIEKVFLHYVNGG